MESPAELKHRDLTESIIGVFFDVYNELGHGFLESVYEEALVVALLQAGLQVQRQLPMPVFFRGGCIAEFRADLVVQKAIIVELKAARRIDNTFEKQLLNYLRATPMEVGLLLNFGERPEFRRFVFENERKQIRVHPRQSAAKGAQE